MVNRRSKNSYIYLICISEVQIWINRIHKRAVILHLNNILHLLHWNLGAFQQAFHGLFSIGMLDLLVQT